MRIINTQHQLAEMRALLKNAIKDGKLKDEERQIIQCLNDLDFSERAKKNHSALKDFLIGTALISIGLLAAPVFKPHVDISETPYNQPNFKPN
jgi:hypothetical protein